MSLRIRYALAIAGIVVISAATGAVAGFAASGLHSGPAGRDGSDASARGCWTYSYPNRPVPIFNTICLERR